MIIRIKVAVPMPMYIVQFSLGFLYKVKYDGSDSTRLPYGEGELALIPEISTKIHSGKGAMTIPITALLSPTKSQLEELLIILSPPPILPVSCRVLRTIVRPAGCWHSRLNSFLFEHFSVFARLVLPARNPVGLPLEGKFGTVSHVKALMNQPLSPPTTYLGVMYLKQG
jgi:hypothetical protein